MRGHLFGLLVVAVVLVVAPAAAGDNPEATGADSKPAGVERAPAVSGRFYPADPAGLASAVRAYLDDALAPRPERPIALVAPHAGFIYSGQIAGDAYRQAMEHEYDLVVILGTNHTAPPFDGVSVHGGSAYRTPLGPAVIDPEIAGRLHAADPAFRFRPAVHPREHSVEVQVPFVQVAFPGVKILPAVVGRPDAALCRRFGRALAAALHDRRALVVASSDLSHYPAHDDAVAADRAVLAAIASMDGPSIRTAITREMGRGRSGLDTCACGLAPVLAAIETARALGANHGAVISYANSGDTAIGDRSRVVGYGAVVFTKGEPGRDLGALERVPLPAAEVTLGPADKRALLAFARRSIARYLDSGTAPLARGFAPVLHRKQGVFVTLKKDGRLRGCIGHRAEDVPLAQIVGSMALQAAFNDRRFRPLDPKELQAIEIEVSLLTPEAPIGGPEEVVVGRDGVFLRSGRNAAVFLPQVATENEWGRDEYLGHLCQKAGLPSACWQGDVELYTFQAEVFGETEHR